MACGVPLPYRSPCRRVGERVVGAHADSNRATVEVGLRGAVDVEAEFAVLLWPGSRSDR